MAAIGLVLSTRSYSVAWQAVLLAAGTAMKVIVAGAKSVVPDALLFHRSGGNVSSTPSCRSIPFEAYSLIRKVGGEESIALSFDRNHKRLALVLTSIDYQQRDATRGAPSCNAHIHAGRVRYWNSGILDLSFP